jgi:GGDEF domain-containing protein
MQQAIARPDMVVMVVSLKNLNYFHEVYGFVASDDLLRAVSIMVRDAVRDLGSPEDFIGHLTASDFLVITRHNCVASLRDRIRKRLEQSFDYFYSDQDRELGTFRDKQLAVQINDLALSSLQRRELPALKAELEQFCH